MLKNDGLYLDIDSEIISPDELSRLASEYPLVHEINRSVVDKLIKPNLDTGPWIAGGAALLWYQGKHTGYHDIDIFCANSRQRRELINRIQFRRDSKLIVETANALTYSILNHKIQVISFRDFKDVNDVIDNFDITVCQIATDGKKFIFGSTTVDDINNRCLKWNGNYSKTDPLKRLAKYWIYGFWPSQSMVEELQADTELVWTRDINEDAEQEYSVEF